MILIKLKKISSNGTNTITITTAGFSTDEEVTLSVTKDMLLHQ